MSARSATFEDGSARGLRRSLLVIAALGVAFAGVITLPAAATTSASRSSALVGRWERVTTCQELVSALAKAGLRKTAPAMLAGNGFVTGTPKQLARRATSARAPFRAATRTSSRPWASSGRSTTTASR
jgi:hypothetical protein